MKRILSVAMAAAFAGAMSAVQAQSIPTLEACAKYAEADVAFNGLVQEAKAAFGASVQDIYDAHGYDALKQEHLAAITPPSDHERADALAAKMRAASDAVDAARPALEAARDDTIEAAEIELTQTYLAVYAEGGGTQSDVWEVMVKLLNQQRSLCTEVHGL